MTMEELNKLVTLKIMDKTELLFGIENPGKEKEYYVLELQASELLPHPNVEQYLKDNPDKTRIVGVSSIKGNNSDEARKDNLYETFLNYINRLQNYNGEEL